MQNQASWNTPETGGKMYPTLYEPWHLFDMEPYATGDVCQWSPMANIIEGESFLEVHVELPGMKQDEISIQVNDWILTITGERKLPAGYEHYNHVEGKYGHFCRSFTLKNTVNSMGIEATMTNGVLKVMVPKTKEAMPRTIKIS